jgi:hypothetical protein
MTDAPEPIQTPEPDTAEGEHSVPAIRDKPQLVAQESVLAIMPTSIEEAGRYAMGLVRAGIVPDAFKDKATGQANPELVMMGVLKSMELGVPPQTGLAGLLPINGRFSVWGDLAAALVQRTGQVEKQETIELGAGFDPNTAIADWPAEYGFRVLYWRTGQETPYVGEFTVRDAKRAGLWANAARQPWLKYPKRMLFNRARAFALRDGFADGLSGLTIAEEAMDVLPPPVDERGPSKRLSALLDEPEETAVADETPPEADEAEKLL